MGEVVHFVDRFLVELDDALELVLVLDVEVLEGQDILGLGVAAFHGGIRIQIITINGYIIKLSFSFQYL